MLSNRFATAYRGRGPTAPVPANPQGRTFGHRSGMASHYPQAISDSISTLRHQLSWKEWDELQILVANLPRDITTEELWSCFAREGHVNKIDIKEDSRGLRNGKATVSFK